MNLERFKATNQEEVKKEYPLIHEGTVKAIKNARVVGEITYGDFIYIKNFYTIDGERIECLFDYFTPSNS